MYCLCKFASIVSAFLSGPTRRIIPKSCPIFPLSGFNIPTINFRYVT